MSIIVVNVDNALHSLASVALHLGHRAAQAVEKKRARVWDLSLSEWMRQSLVDRNITVWPMQLLGPTQQMCAAFQHDDSVTDSLLSIAINALVVENKLFQGSDTRKTLLSSIVLGLPLSERAVSETLTHVRSVSGLREVHEDQVQLGRRHECYGRLPDVIQSDSTIVTTAFGRTFLKIRKSQYVAVENNRLVVYAPEGDDVHQIPLNHYSMTMRTYEYRIWHLVILQSDETSVKFVDSVLDLLADDRPEEDYNNDLHVVGFSEITHALRMIQGASNAIKEARCDYDDTNGHLVSNGLALTRKGRRAVMTAGNEARALRAAIEPKKIAPMAAAETSFPLWIFTKFTQDRLKTSLAHILDTVSNIRDQIEVSSSQLPLRALVAMKVLSGYEAPRIIEKELSRRKITRIQGMNDEAVFIPESDTLYTAVETQKIDFSTMEITPGESRGSLRPYLFDQILMSHIVPREDQPDQTETDPELDRMIGDMLLNDFDDTIVNWPMIARSKCVTKWKGRVMNMSAVMETVYGNSSFRHGLDRSMMVWLLQCGAEPSRQSEYACLARLIRAERRMPSSGLLVNFDQPVSTEGLELFVEIVSDGNYMDGTRIVVDELTGKAYSLDLSVRLTNFNVVDIRFKGNASDFRLERIEGINEKMRVGGLQHDVNIGCTQDSGCILFHELSRW